MTKKGIKEAHAGNLNQALQLFLKATDASFHIKPKKMRIKIGLEILTVQNFCEAIRSISDGDFVTGNDKYNNYENYFDNYNDICKTDKSDIPSVGCKYFIDTISELTNKYQNQLDLLKSK